MKRILALKQYIEIKPTDNKLEYLIKGLIDRFFTDDIGGSAVQMAYYILFSIFPFFIFVNALVGFFNIPISNVIAFTSNFMPKQVTEMFNLYLIHILSIRSTWLLILGFMLSYTSLSRAVKYLIFALLKAYRIKDKSTLMRANIMSLFFTLTMFLTIVLTTFFMTVSSNIIGRIWVWLNMPVTFLPIWDIMRFLLIAAILIFTLALLYYLVPRRQIPFRSTLPGTLIAMLCIVIASIAFSFYVNNIATYSVIYGSFGTVIAFMMWLFMMSNIIIIGGEINHLLILFNTRKMR